MDGDDREPLEEVADEVLALVRELAKKREENTIVVVTHDIAATLNSSSRSNSARTSGASETAVSRRRATMPSF